MTETFVLTCWIQQFKIVFFCKYVGNENIESNHLSKYPFNFKYSVIFPNFFSQWYLSKIRIFSNHLSGRSFYSCLFSVFFFIVDAHMHVLTAEVKMLATSIVISLPSKVMFQCIFGWVGEWVSRWLQIIFYSKRL